MLAKIKTSIVKRKALVIYLLSFVVPCIVLVALFVALRIFPFGPNALLLSNLNGQYISFYSYLQYAFKVMLV